MVDKTLRRLFQEETGIHWKDSNGNPLISYVQYLEEIVVKNNAVLPLVSKRCSHCLYRKYRPNAKHRYELNQCQISGHNLTDVENYSCEHYKPIPNVC